MNLKTIQAISSLGVSEKAAQIYLSSLSLGTTTIQALALKAQIKRPTAYLHMGELIHAGLMKKVPVGKKELFEPVEPSVLENLAKRNLQSIQEIVKSLENIQVGKAGRPIVNVFEGRKGVQKVYDEIKKADSICFWSNLAMFENSLDEEFNEISTVIAKNQIRAREIIPDTLESRRSSKRYALLAGNTYSCRISTRNGISNDAALFGDTLALFRIQEYNLYVVKIKDVRIVSSIKALFDMAWDKAKIFIN